MAMKINTKLRYGLRMLLALAEEPGKVRSTAELGEAMKVSPKYLRKLAGPMEKAGLIDSVQGIYGGYRLQMSPDLISIQKLFSAFNEKIRLSDCVNGDTCPLFDTCYARPLWDYLVDLIEYRFASITLTDIIRHTFDRSLSCENVQPLRRM
ncbi:MAG TPA: Rrf2 family transcriptional regulator [Candidatus Aminicenantes bacterium]|nr:Rrf2 family transcriptional regulator [Candidatus Aminicenantes bacterium]